jgi:hypothetical protein
VLYGTTREFLEHFGLRDLEDLPPFEPPAGAPGEKSAGTETGEAVAAAVEQTARGPEAGLDRSGEERGHPSPA